MSFARSLAWSAALICALGLGSAAAETRLGLVIGNAGYPDRPLKTAANDGALVAETLRSVGFDVAEGRDLDQTTMRRLVRDFIGKVEAADDDVVIFVYYAGHALQAGGGNYLAPLDARLERPADATAETYALNALLTDLAASKSKTRFVVIDAATELPFVAQAKLARGLAMVEALPGSLVAFAAAPGEVMPPQNGDYGVYAQALLEMLREPGLAPDEVFNRVKLRVHEQTKGAVTPEHVSALSVDFRFLERAEPAPAAAGPDPRTLTMAQLDAAAAYALALERDTLKVYQEFLAVYPSDPLARKIRARLAKKREAVAWRRATTQRTRESFWTYRKWYPRGPHFEDAGYELIALSAPLAPPPDFVEVVWDEVGPPVVEEYVYFEDVIPAPLAYADIPPPPLPVMFLPAPIAYAPPPPPAPAPGVGLLPVIGLAAVPAVAALPRVVRRPPPRPMVPAGVPPRPGAILPRPVVINPPGAPGGVRPPVGARPGQVRRPAGRPLPGQIEARPPFANVPGRPVAPRPLLQPPAEAGPRVIRPGRGPGQRVIEVAPRVRPNGPPARQPGQRQPGVREPVGRQPVVRPEIARRPPPLPRQPGLVTRPQIGPGPAVRQAPAFRQPPPQAQPRQVVRQAPVFRQPPPQAPRPQTQPQRPRCAPGVNIPGCAR
jgi:uncharacterized caspase-like protein